jgi:hypothetical protein
MENEIGEYFYDKLIFKVLAVKLSLAQVIRNLYENYSLQGLLRFQTTLTFSVKVCSLPVSFSQDLLYIPFTC